MVVNADEVGYYIRFDILRALLILIIYLLENNINFLMLLLPIETMIYL